MIFRTLQQCFNVVSNNFVSVDETSLPQSILLVGYKIGINGGISQNQRKGKYVV